MSKMITDPEVLEFISRTNAASRGIIGLPSIAQERQAYDRVVRAFQAPRPPSIAVEDTTISTSAGFLAIRRYWPTDPGAVRIIYYHGGGFSLGGLDSHDSICAEISEACKLEVVSVAYRLCPEHPHPSGYNDALASAQTLADRPVILVGDSAGANLAAAVSLEGIQNVAGQVLIYPDLGGTDLPSHSERADAPLLSMSDVAMYRALRAEGMPHPNDRTLNPLRAKDFSKAAPCFVSTAEHDPLRDEGAAFVLKLTEAGIASEAVIEPELPHGHLRARHMSTRARTAFDRICQAISRLAAKAAT